MTVYKIGDRVRCKNAMPVDMEVGIRDGAVGVVHEVCYVAFVKFEGVDITQKVDNNRGGAWAMSDHQLELVDSEIPPMPFFFKHKDSGESYRVDNENGRPILTSVRTGEKFKCYSLEIVKKLVRNGVWVVIEDHTPSVDPATSASLEVQRLLREREAAGAERDAAQVVLDKAEEKYRNAGRALNKAKCDLDRVNHEAAGVKFNPSPYGIER